MMNGVKYGFNISLPLKCVFSYIVTSSAFNSVPYFSFIFVTKFVFCSSVILVVVMLTASLYTSIGCIKTG